MAARDELFENISKFIETRSQEREAVERASYERTLSAAKSTYKTIDTLVKDLESTLGKVSAAKVGEIAKTTGVSAEEVKGHQNYYKSIIKLEGELNKKMKDRNVKFKEAVDLQLQELKTLKGIDAALNNKIAREESILRTMREQNKIRERSMKMEALSRKVAGGPATAMGKYAATGKTKKGAAAGGAKAGMAARAVAGVGAVVVGAIYAAGQALMAITTMFMKNLTRVWDQGIQGILENTVSFASSLAGLLSDKLGAMVGAIGGLLVRMYMLHLNDWIAGQRMGVRMLAETGKAGGEAFFGSMLKTTQGIRSRAIEWGESAIATTTKITAAFGESFYRVGQTMDLTAQQTSEFFKRSLISASEDTNKATDNLRMLFSHSKEMAKDTGISSKFFANAIADASVQARMFNVDMKSVANTMELLKNKQKTLASFGIEMRSQGDKILNALVSAPKQWSMALHAFAGMEMYGKDYMQKTGEQMGAGFAYMASRFGGLEKARAIGFTETGALTMGKVGATPEDLMATRLDTMISHVRSQTSGIENVGERMMAQQMMLKNVWGIQDESARIAIMQLDKGDKSALANDAIRLSMLTERQISEKMLSAQEKTEQYQRIIAAMTPMIVSLIRLLPNKLGYMIAKAVGVKPAAETKAGAEAFDAYVDAMKKSLSKLAGPAKGLIDPILKGYEQGGKARDKFLFGTEERYKKTMASLMAERKEGPSLLTTLTGGKAEWYEAIDKRIAYVKEGYAKLSEAEKKRKPGVRGSGITVGTPKARLDVKSKQGGGLASAGSPYVIHPGMESIQLSGSEALFVPGGDMNLVPHSEKTPGGGKMSQINITLYGYNSPSDIVTAVQEGLANMA